MSRKPDELLNALLDGELTAAEQAAVERQLADSPALRQTFEELRALRGDLESLPQYTLGPDFAALVVNQALAASQANDRAEVLPNAMPAVAAAPTPEPTAPVKVFSTATNWLRRSYWAAAAMAAALVIVLYHPRVAPDVAAPQIARQPERPANPTGDAPSLQGNAPVSTLTTGRPGESQPGQAAANGESVAQRESRYGDAAASPRRDAALISPAPDRPLEKQSDKLNEMAKDRQPERAAAQSPAADLANQPVSATPSPKPSLPAAPDPRAIAAPTPAAPFAASPGLPADEKPAAPTPPPTASVAGAMAKSKTGPDQSVSYRQHTQADGVTIVHVDVTALGVERDAVGQMLALSATKRQFANENRARADSLRLTKEADGAPPENFNRRSADEVVARQAAPGVSVLELAVNEAEFARLARYADEHREWFAAWRVDPPQSVADRFQEQAERLPAPATSTVEKGDRKAPRRNLASGAPPATDEARPLSEVGQTMKSEAKFAEPQAGFGGAHGGGLGAAAARPAPAHPQPAADSAPPTADLRENESARRRVVLVIRTSPVASSAAKAEATPLPVGPAAPASGTNSPAAPR